MAMDSNSNLVRFGTSSFSSGDWVGPFYPAGTEPRDFLALYAQRFDTVEVDSTYYALPKASIVARWAEVTPPGFLIAAKFPRAIVHCGKSWKPDAREIMQPDTTYAIRDKFLESLSQLGDKLGPLLLQFPFFDRTQFPSARLFVERLDRFLTDLPKEFRFAVEIRNKAWLTEEFVDLLRSHEVALTLVDHAWMPHGEDLLTKLDPVTSDFVYIRLLGDRKKIETLTKTWDKEVIDQSTTLSRWANVLFDLAAKGIPSLVYINNHFAGHAPATLRQLRELYRQLVDAHGAK